MHDWKQMVRTSLRNLHIDPTQEKDIVSELASHLEDKYDEARSSGLSDGEACELCRMELADGQSTARKIQLAKIKEGAMNYRTKTLWIPGLVTLTVASVVLMVVERIVLSQPKVSSASSAALSYYVPWLISLPFCGALGAYLSRRAGGNSLSSVCLSCFSGSRHAGRVLSHSSCRAFYRKEYVHHPSPAVLRRCGIHMDRRSGCRIAAGGGASPRRICALANSVVGLNRQEDSLYPHTQP